MEFPVKFSPNIGRRSSTGIPAIHFSLALDDGTASHVARSQHIFWFRSSTSKPSMPWLASYMWRFHRYRRGFTMQSKAKAAARRREAIFYRGSSLRIQAGPRCCQDPSTWGRGSVRRHPPYIYSCDGEPGHHAPPDQAWSFILTTTSHTTQGMSYGESTRPHSAGSGGRARTTRKSSQPSLCAPVRLGNPLAFKYDLPLSQ